MSTLQDEDQATTGWRFDDHNWRTDAACVNQDPDRFFAGKGRPRKDSRTLCGHCPVRRDCLETALSSPWMPYGTWGGKTSAELMPEWERRHQGDRSEVLRALGLR